MASQQNYPGGGFYAGQQGYPGYPGGQGYPGGPGYPGGYPPPQEGYPGFQPPPYSGGGPPPPGFVPPPQGVPFGHVPPPQSGMYGASYVEDPQGEVKGFQFNDTTIRQGFIKKVYSVLMLQLLLTFGIIALFSFNQNVKLFAQRNPSIMFVCLIITFVMIISMACCTNVRRQAPTNYIFLLIFTGAEGVLLGFLTSRYAEDTILMAVGITAVICFALTLFAFQTKFDFTGAGTYLFIAAIVFMLFGFLLIFFHNRTAHLVYSCLGALLFSFYLVYDTQLMLGGNHKYSLSPEEYIFAALNLYIDIINIFIYILSILGNTRD